MPQPRQKKNSLGIWILLLVLLGGGYAAYHYSTHSRSQETAPAQEPAKLHKKKKAPKPEAGNKAAQPTPEAADPFEEETATAEEQPPQEPSPAAVQPAEDKADAPAEAGDEETVPEAVAEKPAETDDADDAKEAAPGRKGKTVFHHRQSSRTFPQRTYRRNRIRRQAPRNGTQANYQYGGRQRVHQEVCQGASPEPVEETVLPALYKLVRQQGRDSRRVDHYFRPPRIPCPGSGYVLANPNFRGMFPKSLLDPNGDPVANVYVVTQVIEGSPAEKYVNKGDVILGIDGQPFKTSLSLDVPYGPYQFQDSRGLDMHAGLLVDKAEGAGKITLNLIPAENVEKVQGLQPLWKEVFREEKAKKPVNLSISVQGGQQIRPAR